jgi:DNA-directed RNA polymerase subunit alpha
MLFSDEKISLEENAIEEFDEDTLHMRQLLKTDLTEFGLSVRALNCLKTAEVFTLGELVSFKKSDMLKFRNFGKKSLTELEDLIAEKGLTFGFDIAKYNLDNE